MRLLRAALQLGRLPAHEAARASFDLETLTRAWSGASTIRRFARIAEDLADRGDDRRALDALGRGVGAGLLGPAGRQDEATRVGVRRAARRAGRRSTASGGARAHRSDPPRPRRSSPGSRQMSPAGMPGPDESMAVGRAAMAVWADNLALPFLRSAVAGYRSDGRLARLAQCLVYEAWADINCGAVRIAITGAAEAARLAEEARQLRYVLAAKLAHAIAAAELRRGGDGRPSDRRRRGGARADGRQPAARR